jgi:hypothetical protein
VNTPLIWWTSEADARQLGEPHALADFEGYPEDLATVQALPGILWRERITWPEYLWIEYRSRYGRAGRGRLWVALHVIERFGRGIRVSPWPTTALGQRLGREAGGIVVMPEDLPLVRSLPGLVTDLELHLIP